MQEALSIGFMIVGTFFILVGGIAIVRLPDVFLRMSATTKVATLGVGFTLLATAIYFNNLGVTSRAIATIIFVMLTAPVSAHMIGRAAYFDGVPLWKGTVLDELRGRYDAETHELASSTQAATAPDPDHSD